MKNAGIRDQYFLNFRFQKYQPISVNNMNRSKHIPIKYVSGIIGDKKMAVGPSAPPIIPITVVPSYDLAVSSDMKVIE